MIIAIVTIVTMTMIMTTILRKGNDKNYDNVNYSGHHHDSGNNNVANGANDTDNASDTTLINCWEPCNGLQNAPGPRTPQGQRPCNCQVLLPSLDKP